MFPYKISLVDFSISFLGAKGIEKIFTREKYNSEKILSTGPKFFRVLSSFYAILSNFFFYCFSRIRLYLKDRLIL